MTRRSGPQAAPAIAVSLASTVAGPQGAQTNCCDLLLEDLLLPPEAVQCVDVSPICIVVEDGIS